jgi:hypothetical protein
MQLSPPPHIWRAQLKLLCFSYSIYSSAQYINITNINETLMCTI